jgi:hypothetical protein
MAHSACLVCFISTVNGRIKKRREKKTWKPGASSGHITNLKQSIFCLSISMVADLTIKNLGIVNKITNLSEFALI